VASLEKERGKRIIIINHHHRAIIITILPDRHLDHANDSKRALWLFIHSELCFPNMHSLSLLERGLKQGREQHSSLLSSSSSDHDIM